MKHLNIQVFGKVQGVSFRDSAQKNAWALQLKGIVRNEPDGTVWIEAEGPESAIDELVAWCQKGPKKAAVERVETAEAELEDYTAFHVTYC